VRRVRVRAKVVVGKCMVGFVGGWMVGVLVEEGSEVRCGMEWRWGWG
jgi:hypothetical protein